MSRTMKPVTAPTRDDRMVIVTPPAGRGPRVVQRGGKHGSGKHLGRSRSKRQWRRESAEGRHAAQAGQLV